MLSEFKKLHGVFISLDISLTVFITLSGIVVLFVMLVMVMMGGLDGSSGLPTITTTTATMMAAVATNTKPDITTLWFFLSQRGTSLSWVSLNGKAS